MRGDDISIRQRVDQVPLSHFPTSRSRLALLAFDQRVEAYKVSWIPSARLRVRVSQSQASQIPRSHDEILP